MVVRVISRKHLKEFASGHADAGEPLEAWRKLIHYGRFTSFAELKRTFRTADYVRLTKGGFYIFDIGGNKYRLVAAIHFNRQMLFIRGILTHAEYTRGSWKNKL